MVKIPTPSVKENPFMGPDPMKNKIIAANNVVIFASRIAVLDLVYPLSKAIKLFFSFLSSSLILSKIKTLASTAIPTVNIIPAIPGKVKVASKIVRTPIKSNKLITKAILVIKPNILYLKSIKRITRINPISRGGGRKATTINLLDILDLKDVSKNIRILDGDTIFVSSNDKPLVSQITKALKSNINPKYINVFVAGRVTNPGKIRLNKISTLNNAIDLSGGAKILRGPVRFLRYKNDGTIEKRKI